MLKDYEKYINYKMASFHIKGINKIVLFSAKQNTHKYDETVLREYLVYYLSYSHILLLNADNIYHIYLAPFSCKDTRSKALIYGFHIKLSRI